MLVGVKENLGLVSSPDMHATLLGSTSRCTMAISSCDINITIDRHQGEHSVGIEPTYMHVLVML
jgi:hypothetical protein